MRVRRSDGPIARVLRLALLLALAAIAVAAVAACGDSDGGGARRALVFSDLNWPSALIQNRIAGFIAEHGYGYEVDYIPGETISLWQGLLNNDTDITMEVWLPNHQEPYDKGIADGTVLDAGRSLDDNWQGFGIPRYIKDQNPGLVWVFDLPDYIDLFTTADSHGKARFVNCLTGWACAQNNETKLASYGLLDLVELVDPGSTAAMVADLDAIFSSGGAWLGYIWGPSIPATRFDLYVLEEPPYNEQCWADGYACAYPTAEIKIVVHKTLPERAPEIYDFLKAWDFSAQSYLDTAGWMDASGETPENAAFWFLRNRREVWSGFLPADVVERVDSALADLG